MFEIPKLCAELVSDLFSLPCTIRGNGLRPKLETTGSIHELLITFLTTVRMHIKAYYSHASFLECPVLKMKAVFSHRYVMRT